VVDRNWGQGGGHAICTETLKHIIEFTSGRPKYYAYMVITNEVEETVCKVSGITLYYHAQNW